MNKIKIGLEIGFYSALYLCKYSAEIDKKLEIRANYERNGKRTVSENRYQF